MFLDFFWRNQPGNTAVKYISKDCIVHVYSVCLWPRMVQNNTRCFQTYFLDDDHTEVCANLVNEGLEHNFMEIRIFLGIDYRVIPYEINHTWKVTASEFLET